MVTLCRCLPYSTWDAFLKYAFLSLFGGSTSKQQKLACYDRFLHAVQGRDTSQSKEHIVQGTQYPRIFVLRHIGRGFIVPASVHGC
jgi:hypothetical protein